jgi:hypothetical protein
MDSSERDSEGDAQDSGVRELTSVSHRRDSDWPFKYSVTSRGVVINRLPPRKKGAKQDLGEALL